jgi:hypothetical protein
MFKAVLAVVLLSVVSGCMTSEGPMSDHTSEQGRSARARAGETGGWPLAASDSGYRLLTFQYVLFCDACVPRRGENRSTRPEADSCMMEITEWAASMCRQTLRATTRNEAAGSDVATKLSAVPDNSPRGSGADTLCADRPLT